MAEKDEIKNLKAQNSLLNKINDANESIIDAMRMKAIELKTKMNEHRANIRGNEVTLSEVDFNVINFFLNNVSDEEFGWKKLYPNIAEKQLVIKHSKETLKDLI